jgi:hypothetical protein
LDGVGRGRDGVCDGTYRDLVEFPDGLGEEGFDVGEPDVGRDAESRGPKTKDRDVRQDEFADEEVDNVQPVDDRQSSIISERVVLIAWDPYALWLTDLLKSASVTLLPGMK